ncbi:MAG: hypothetical protein ACW967_01035 [Candidatus Hodarchaeales archaeon]|jgi:arginine repressor
MTTTTRRITENELKRLKEIQKYLEQKQIKLSQSEISELITKYTIDNLEDFLNTLRIKKNKQKADPLESWINTPVEGKKVTNSVYEHDETI